MREYLKTGITLIITLSVLGFVAFRARSLFQGTTFHIESTTAPTLPSSVLESFRNYYHHIERDARANRLPFDSIFFVEVRPTDRECWQWRTEKLTNTGMNPMTQFERGSGFAVDRLIGYYTLEGEPLQLQYKHLPPNPQQPSVTVELPDALTPGQTVLVLRVERAPTKLQPNSAGNFSFNFPRLSNTDDVIRASAFCLPAGKMLSYRPQGGVYESTTGCQLFGWINSRLDDRAPAPLVTFKLP